MNFSPLFLLAASRTPAKLTGHASPALRPVRVSLAGVLLVRSPSLHLLRRRSCRDFVPEVSSVLWACVTSLVVRRRLTAWAFRRVPTAPSTSGDGGSSGSQPLETPYMLGVFDRAGSSLCSRCGRDVAFRSQVRRRHPNLRFRGSIVRPVCTPVNASTAPLRIQPRMTRGHRSLVLRCRALSSPSPSWFIPALTCPQKLIHGDSEKERMDLGFRYKGSCHEKVQVHRGADSPDDSTC